MSNSLFRLFRTARILLPVPSPIVDDSPLDDALSPIHAPFDYPAAFPMSKRQKSPLARIAAFSHEIDSPHKRNDYISHLHPIQKRRESRPCQRVVSLGHPRDQKNRTK